MPRRPSYVISRAARNDLAAIDDYTGRQWSDAQARCYIAALWASFDAAAQDPHLGLGRAGLRPNLRLHAVGSHFVVYRLGTDDRVEVVNVLHQAMDLRRRLATRPAMP